MCRSSISHDRLALSKICVGAGDGEDGGVETSSRVASFPPKCRPNRRPGDCVGGRTHRLICCDVRARGGTNVAFDDGLQRLAAAAALMLDGDCGILPVIEDGKLVGVVTDRDMYIALATRNKRASEISVGEVVQTPVFTCGPDDDVQAVLETMKQHCVRRLPVEGFGGTIMGIVSMNDIVLASGPRTRVRDVEVVNTLQAICAHHHPSPHIAAA